MDTEASPEAMARATAQQELVRSPSGLVATPSRWLQVGPLAGAIAVAVLFGWIRKDSVIVGELLTFLLAVFLIARFPTITKLKALGVEVEVERAVKAKEDAERAAEEAKATAEQLRTVTSTLGRLTLDQLAMAGRLGGAFPPIEKQKIRAEVLRSLYIAGCSDEEIAVGSRLLDRSMEFDLIGRIFPLAGVLAGPREAAFYDAANQLRAFKKRSSPLSTTERFNIPSVDEIRRLLDDHEITDARVLRRLADYERFIQDQTVPLTDTDEDELAELRKEMAKT